MEYEDDDGDKDDEYDDGDDNDDHNDDDDDDHNDDDDDDDDDDDGYRYKIIQLSIFLIKLVHSAPNLQYRILCLIFVRRYL